MDEYTLELLSFKKGGMPPRNKKISGLLKGAGMTEKVLKLTEV